MKTEKIVIEIPAHTSVEEVQHILRDLADMLGKNKPGQEIKEAFDTLRRAAWRKGREPFFPGTASA